MTTYLADMVDLIVTLADDDVSCHAGAIRQVLSHALIALNPQLRPSLKTAGFLTRKPKEKEGSST